MMVVIMSICSSRDEYELLMVFYVIDPFQYYHPICTIFLE